MITKLKRSVLCLIAVSVVLGGSRVALPSDPVRPVLILIGPPLSGKTSLVTSIQRTYRIPGISIEDLIISHAPELRRMHPEDISLAEMRYDPAISRYVRTLLAKMDLGRGVALDGFPATRSQAEDLATMIADFRLSPIVLQLEIPDDTVRKRATQGGRQSDRPEIIEQRIKDYHREFDMISVYFPKAKIVKIDGTKPEEVMWKAIQQGIEQLGVRP
jgi:adenylate kinase family enzyme